MKLILKLSLCLCLLIGLSVNSHAQQEKTPATTNILPGKIVDTENIFTKAEIKALESQIYDFMQTTNISMSIVVRSTPNTSAASNQWSFRNIDAPKGILIMISKTSKEINVGVGNELSKTLPKAKVDDIINTTILTEFEKDQYATGISNSLKALVKQLVH